MIAAEIAAARGGADDALSERRTAGLRRAALPPLTRLAHGQRSVKGLPSLPLFE